MSIDFCDEMILNFTLMIDRSVVQKAEKNNQPIGDYDMFCLLKGRL